MFLKFFKFINNFFPNFQIHSGTGSPLLLLPTLKSLLLVMVAVVTSNIQATTTNLELSDGSTAERREWNVKPIVCESVPYHVLWKRLQVNNQ